METAFSFALPPAVIAVAAVLGVIFAAIFPTALYLYVEPRGRRQWAVAGDNADTRRAQPGMHEARDCRDGPPERQHRAEHRGASHRVPAGPRRRPPP